jgi:hypothetical protein
MKLDLIKIIFNHISGILYFISALLGLMGFFMPRANMYIKIKCKKFLKIIDESKWVQLPERVIKKLIVSIDNFEKEILNLSLFIRTYQRNVKSKKYDYFWYLLIAILPSVCHYMNISIPFKVFIYYFIGLLFFLLIMRIFLELDEHVYENNKYLLILIIVVTFICSSLYIAPVLILYIVFIKSNIYISLFLMPVTFIYFIILMKYLPFSMFDILSEKYNKIDASILFIIIIIFLSSFITLLSLTFGHTIMPDLWIPKTTKMIISNIIFDIFTVYATFYLLKWAIKKHSIYRIPIAIIIDIIFASLFACLSLYFGLIFSEKSLSIVETLNILIAKSPGGNTFEYGPYFWVMHTTFIPTLLYLLIVSFSWYAKIILIPIVWLFGEIQSKNSLQAFALMLALMAAFFHLLYLYV